MTIINLSGHRISLSELLQRPSPALSGDRVREHVQGRRVLVTGAGGSIGSEIVRQVSGLDAAAVYLLDHDENALHTIQLELHGHGLLDTDTMVLADIRDRVVMDQVMAKIKPNLVFHAAAHKHLPLLERFPAEAVKTNVLGTANVVTSALTQGADTFINISTDKAARPTSVLGATKRLAEMIVSGHAGMGMQVASVRFGNVLGSHGSFLWSLAHQIAHGRPVTVTDPDVTRFFMTIPEAAGLVVEASTMADAGEIYVLDMGTPVRIVDLVERYLHAIGKASTRIVYTGLRQGEKLHEELFDTSEVRYPTSHQRITCVQSPVGEMATTTSRALTLAELGPTVPADVLRADVFALLPSLVPHDEELAIA